MGLKFIDDTYLTNIANAIRTKAGTSAQLSLSDMPTAISNISGGGSNETPTTGWIDAYLTQDSTPYYTSTSSTSTVTPTKEWELHGLYASLNLYNASASYGNIFVLYDAIHSLIQFQNMGSSGVYLSANTVFPITCKTINYSDLSSLSRFGAYGALNTSSSSSYVYYDRLRPLIYTPTDYTITSSTKVDVMMFLETLSSNYNIKCYFKYRIYEPVSMTGKTYKDEDGNVLANVSSISLNKSTTTLTEGESETLTATVLPSNAIYKGVNWTSTDDYTTVDSSGVISTVFPGTATITATSIADTSKSASCSVEVTSSISSDYSNISNPTTHSYYTMTLVEDKTDYVYFSTTSNSTYTPYTSNLYLIKGSDTSSVLTLTNTNGYVDYTNSASATTFTIANISSSSYLSSSAYFTFTVPSNCTQIKFKYYKGRVYVRYLAQVVPPTAIDITDATVGISSTKTLVPTYTPSYATPSGTLTWASSNTDIATVDSNGVVSGISSGTANITVTDAADNISDTCSITVSAVSYTNITSSNVNTSAGGWYDYTTDTISNLRAFTTGLYSVSLTVDDSSITVVNSTSLSDLDWQEYTASATTIVVSGASSGSFTVTLPTNSGFRYAFYQGTSSDYARFYIQYIPATSPDDSDDSDDGWTPVTYSYSDTSVVSDSDGVLTYSSLGTAGRWKPYIDGSYYTPTSEFQTVNGEYSGSVTYFDTDDDMAATATFTAPSTAIAIRFKYVDGNSKQLLMEYQSS